MGNQGENINLTTNALIIFSKKIVNYLIYQDVNFLHNILHKITVGSKIMGKILDKNQHYKNLKPEEMFSYVRKNISIPKYMDIFLYKNKISLSKLVQNAITLRIQEEQEKSIEKKVIRITQQKKLQDHYEKERKKNPNLDWDLERAKRILTKYFLAYETNDETAITREKSLLSKEFPDLYLDIIKFENWKIKNENDYQIMKEKYENPVERLIRIKSTFF